MKPGVDGGTTGTSALPAERGAHPTPDDLAGSLVGPAADLARRWLESGHADPGRTGPGPPGSTGLTADPGSLAFAMAFCDRVLRPESPEVAARQLRRVVAAGPPRFLSPADRTLLRWGARLSSALPGAVMPLARRRLRALVGGLLADATDPALRRHLAGLRAEGFAGQRQPAGRGRARAHRGGASASRRARTHGAPRRRLRLGQGVVGLRAAQPVVLRGHALANQGRPARRPRAPPTPRRPSSSISTWRNTRTWRSRSMPSSACSTSPSSRSSRRALCCRPTCPSR